MIYSLPPIRIVRFSLKELQEAIKINESRGFKLVGEIKKDVLTRRNFNYVPNSNEKLAKRVYEKFEVNEKYSAVMQKEVSKDDYEKFINSPARARQFNLY